MLKPSPDPVLGAKKTIISPVAASNYFIAYPKNVKFTEISNITLVYRAINDLLDIMGWSLLYAKITEDMFRIKNRHRQGKGVVCVLASLML